MGRVIGRERELATVARFLADASEGFVALALEGDAGVGKTTVWQEAVTLAEEAGIRVLRCRPAQTGGEAGVHVAHRSPGDRG